MPAVPKLSSTDFGESSNHEHLGEKHKRVFAHVLEFTLAATPQPLPLFT